MEKKKEAMLEQQRQLVEEHRRAKQEQQQQATDLSLTPGQGQGENQSQDDPPAEGEVMEGEDDSDITVMANIDLNHERQQMAPTQTIGDDVVSIQDRTFIPLSDLYHTVYSHAPQYGIDTSAESLLGEERVERELEELRSQVQREKEKARSYFHQLHLLLAAREESVLRELDEIVDRVRAELTEKRALLQQLNTAREGLERDLTENKLRELLQKNVRSLEDGIGEVLGGEGV